MSGLNRIPVFVSSAHYGLEDLRGELASFLEELGAAPMVSSEKGFPDHPGLPPYTQCLRILEKSLVVVGIVDKRYGTALSNWGPYPEYEGLSPTHAELRHALTQKKRLWIYVRSEVQGYYDIYRKNKTKFGELALPANLEIKSLEMLSELKLAHPAPWIESFRDIRDVKVSLRNRLLYELVEALTQKEKLAQSGAEILIDRILKIDKPDLDVVVQVLEVLAQAPIEKREWVRRRFERLYAGEEILTSSSHDNFGASGRDIISADQRTTNPQIFLIELSRNEKEVLRILFEHPKHVFDGYDVYKRLQSKPSLAPAHIGEVLMKLYRSGLLLQVNRGSGEGANVLLYTLSQHGLDICSSMRLDALPTESPTLVDSRIYLAPERLSDIRPVPASVEHLIRVALDESRNFSDRSIAKGALLSSAGEFGDQIARRLQKIISEETNESRLKLAELVLSSVLWAKDKICSDGLTDEKHVVIFPPTDKPIREKKNVNPDEAHFKS